MLKDNDVSELRTLYDCVVDGTHELTDLGQAESPECLNKLNQALLHEKQKLVAKSRTAKLWVQIHGVYWHFEVISACRAHRGLEAASVQFVTDVEFVCCNWSQQLCKMWKTLSAVDAGVGTKTSRVFVGITCITYAFLIPRLLQQLAVKKCSVSQLNFFASIIIYHLAPLIVCTNFV